jgi:hypothetical protein
LAGAACLCALGLGAGTESSQSVLEQLKQKYPWGSIYVMYIPLNDMADVLDDDQRFREVAAKPPGPAALKVFKAFLDSTREKFISEAVVFLQLNLHLGKAGYKRLSDRRGEIQELAWTQNQFEGIAQYCDQSLNHFGEYAALKEKVSSGTVSLAKSWKELEKLSTNPYIPTSKMAPLAAEFGKLIDKRPDELKALKRNDRKLHDTIQGFKLNLEDSQDKMILHIEEDRDLEESLKRTKFLAGDLTKTRELDRKWAEFVIKPLPGPGMPPSLPKGGTRLRHILEPTGPFTPQRILSAPAVPQKGKT